MIHAGENQKRQNGFSIDSLLARGTNSVGGRNVTTDTCRVGSPTSDNSRASDTSGVEPDSLQDRPQKHHTCLDGGPCLPCYENRRESPSTNLSSSLPLPPRPSTLLRFREEQMIPFHEKYRAFSGLQASCFGAAENGFDKTIMSHPSLWLASQQEGLNPYSWTLNSGLPPFNVTNDTNFLLPHFRKPKRIRTAFAPSQLLRLEHAFEKNHYVVGQERKDLAIGLSLTETQVKVWFQNRRTKYKRMKAEEEMTRTLTKNIQDRSTSREPHKRVYPKSNNCTVSDSFCEGSDGSDEESDLDV